MIVYNGKRVVPIANTLKGVSFVYHNGNISSTYYDSADMYNNEGKEPLVVHGVNFQKDAFGSYSVRDGQNFHSAPDTMTIPVGDVLGVGVRAILDQSLYFYQVPRGICNGLGWSTPGNQTAVVYENCVFENYTQGGACHHNLAKYNTFENCNFNLISFWNNSWQQNTLQGFNFNKLANHCNINTVALNNYGAQSGYVFGLRYSNINNIYMNYPSTNNAYKSRTNITFNLFNSNINNFTVINGAELVYSTDYKTNVLGIRLEYGNIGNFNCSAGGNYWNRTPAMFNSYYVNYNTFPYNIINLFPRAAGYNHHQSNWGVNIASGNIKEDYSGTLSWQFYQPNTKNIESSAFYFIFRPNKRSGTLIRTPNIFISGFTAESNHHINIANIECPNFLYNGYTNEEVMAWLNRDIAVTNSYLKLSGAAITASVSGYTSTRNSSASQINSTYINVLTSGTSINYISNDYSGDELWNANQTVMNNVRIVGNNMVIKYKGYRDRSSTNNDNSFKFNRGNFFVSNLNLYYANYNNASSYTVRTTPANIRFEFKAHWNSYWNQSVTNAMPTWASMNGILRNVFENIGPAGANVTIDISPQYWGFISVATNQTLLKNMFFGMDATATYGYTNANYAWINISSYMWGQSGINVRLRRVSACNYANNFFYANLYINTN